MQRRGFSLSSCVCDLYVYKYFVVVLIQLRQISCNNWNEISVDQILTLSSRGFMRFMVGWCEWERERERTNSWCHGLSQWDLLNHSAPCCALGIVGKLSSKAVHQVQSHRVWLSYKRIVLEFLCLKIMSCYSLNKHLLL